MDHGQRASDQAGGDSVGAACGPPLFCMSEKKAKNAPKPCKKRKSPQADPPSIRLSQGARKRKKSAKIIPKPYRKKGGTRCRE